MLERLDYIHGALETAEHHLLDGVGMYGREEARAWIWAVLVELEALRRKERNSVTGEQWEAYADARAEAARWPRDEGEDMLEAPREARR